MSTTQSFERQLAAWMADEGSFSPPVGAVDEALSVTSRLRPRPRWLALLRETPMTTQSRVLVGSPTRRLALVIAAVGLAAALAVAGALLLMNTKAATSDWPMFRGSPARVGVGVAGPVGAPSIDWQQTLDGLPSNVAVVGDTAFASTDAGSLVALDLGSGTPRWTFKSTNLGPMTGPTVADGLVFVTDAAGAVIAVDAKSGAQGWTAPLGLVSPSTVGLGNGLAFVGGGTSPDDSGVLVAVESTSGQERWRYSAPGVGPVHNAAFADGVVYAGTENGLVAALDASTGREIWTSTLDFNAGTAVVADGTLYIGVAGNGAGSLVAFQGKTGQTVWRTRDAFQSPVVDGGVGYASSTDGTVAALRLETGTELWRVQLPGPATTPALADGVLYVASDNPGRVYALDAASGGLRWTQDLDAPPACCVAPTHAHVYAATQNGTVVAIAGNGAALTAAPRADFATPKPSSPAESASPSSGPAPTEGPPIAEPAGVLTAPDADWVPLLMTLAPDGRIWASDAFNNRFSVFAADGTFLEFFGTEGDGPGEFKMTRSNGDAYGNVVFLSDGTMLALDIGNRRIQVFDADGKFVRQWGSFGAGEGKLVEPVNLAVDSKETIWLLDDVRGVVIHYTADGTFLDEFDAFPNATSGANSASDMAIDSHDNLYISQLNPYQVSRFDPSGELTGVFGSQGTAPGQFAEQPGALAIDAEGRLFVGLGGPAPKGKPSVSAFDANGTYLGGFGGTADGAGSIGWGTGLLLIDDTLYAGDVGNPPGENVAIRKFTLLPPFSP